MKKEKKDIIQTRTDSNPAVTIAIIQFLVHEGLEKTVHVLPVKVDF